MALDRAALVPAICKRLATGEPLAVICRDLGIGRRTVQLWRKNDPAIDEQMQDARDDGYDVIAHRVRATARGKGDSTQDAQRDKLIIDTDLKLLAKWDKKRYGDSTAVDLTSSDGSMTPRSLNEFYASLPAKRTDSDPNA